MQPVWSVACVLVLGVGLCAAYAQPETEEKTEPVASADPAIRDRLIALIGSQQPEDAGEINGWDVLIATLDGFYLVLEPFDDGSFQGGLDFSLLVAGGRGAAGANGDAEGGPDQRQQVADAASALESSTLFADLARLAATRRVEPPVSESRLLDAPLPDLGRSRRVVRFLAPRMEMAAAADDWPMAVRCFEGGLALSRVIAYQPSVIGRLVAVAIRQMMVPVMGRIVATSAVPDVVLAQIAAILEEQADWPGVQYVVDAEHLLTLDSLHWLHGPDGTIVRRRVEELAGAPIPAGMQFNALDQVEQALEKFHSALRVDIGRTPAIRASEGLECDVTLESLPIGDAIVSILTPAWGNALDTQDWDRSTTHALRLLVAVQRFHAANGAMPPPLAALVPDFLPAIPADALAADGAFLYRHGPEYGGYVLYSVGLDGEDNVAEGELWPRYTRRPDSDGHDMILLRVAE